MGPNLVYHLVNLGLRFVLGLAALVAFGVFGWSMFVVTWMQLFFAAILPVSVMLI